MKRLGFLGPSKKELQDTHREIIYLSSRVLELRGQRDTAEEEARAYNKELVELLSALHGLRNTILQAWSWEAMKNALKPFDEIVDKIHRMLREEETNGVTHQNK
jgi:hypothetical protein